MLRAQNRPLLAFFDAIKNLRLRQLALLLKTGYDPNLMVNSRGQNGLQFMINYFNATDAHFRLQAPTNKAAYLGIAKLLLDSGLDPNSADLLSGESVVFEAIRLNDKEMLALLLNYADFSLRNKDGETALMCAARFGSKQSMRMILEHLRNLNMDAYFLRQRNRFGLTALELARAENLESARVLTKHLIAYGNQVGAVARGQIPRLAQGSRAASLARKQHLLPRPLLASGSLGPLVGPAELLDDESASDYDSDALLAAPLASLGRAGGGRALRAAGCDQKAARFNQYLLEQQEFAAEQQQAGVGAISDDEDYFGQAGGSSGAKLTRSRSCMLGPNSSVYSSKQHNYQASGSSKKQQPFADQSAAKGASSASWETANTGGRNTIA